MNEILNLGKTARQFLAVVCCWCTFCCQL